MRIQQFDYSVNFGNSILWQYDKSPNFNSLVSQKQAWYNVNHTQFWQDWYTNVFNLITANDFGLCVWSIILNAPFLIRQKNPNSNIFGFNTVPSSNHNKNFEWGTFADVPVGSALTMEEQRIFLRLRYFKLITDCTIPAINIFLDSIFNDPEGIYQGGAWALDGLDMTMTYVFNCPISNSLLEAIKVYDMLPHPTGVFLNYEVL